MGGAAELVLRHFQTLTLRTDVMYMSYMHYVPVSHNTERFPKCFCFSYDLGLLYLLAMCRGNVTPGGQTRELTSVPQ